MTSYVILVPILRKMKQRTKKTNSHLLESNNANLHKDLIGKRLRDRNLLDDELAIDGHKGLHSSRNSHSQYWKIVNCK